MTLKTAIVYLESHRKVIAHHAKEIFVAAITIALSATALALADPATSFSLRHGVIAAVSIILVGLLVLARMEVKFLKKRGFRLFSLGGGKLAEVDWRKMGAFMSLWDLALKHPWHPKNGDILLGRISSTQRLFRLWPSSKIGVAGDRHLLTIAPNREGKGAACIIPNLLFYPGSCIVLDPKGENAMVTAARRGAGSHQATRSLGQDVYIIDPEGIVISPAGASLKRAAWNPLAEYSPQQPNFLKDLDSLLYIVIPVNDKTHDPFWDNTARTLMKAIVLHVYSVEEPAKRTLVTVRNLILGGDPEAKACLEAEAAAQGVDWDGDDPTAHEALLALMKQNTDFNGLIAATADNVDSYPDETRGSIWAVLRERTAFLDNLQSVFDKSDFSMEDVIRKPTTVYLCIKATSLASSMSAFIRIFIEAAIKRFEDFQHDKKEHPVLFIMDEFHSLGRTDVMNKALGLVAGFGVRLWPFVQSLSQLKDYYPQTYELFLTACETIQLFGDQDKEMIELLNWRIGLHNQEAVEANRKAEKGEPAKTFSGIEELAPFKALASGMLSRESRGEIVLFNQDAPAFLERLPYYAHFPKNIYDTPSKHK